MKLKTLFTSGLMTTSAFFSCASVAPQELVNARNAYQRAAHGPPAEYAPAELHRAEASLGAAEQAFKDEPDDQHTRDLAYLAERRAQISEAIAQQEMDNKKKKIAEQDFVKTQGKALAESREMLTQAEQTRRQGAQNLDQERSGRMAAEGKAATAENRAMGAEAKAVTAEGRAAEAEAKAAEATRKSREIELALARLAAVKEEQRGLVVTLSGSVLFASNKAELLPSAQARLTQVAEALASSTERTVVVEGHTDSMGSAESNRQLSLRRAQSVRDFLVARGLPNATTRAEGLGKERPVADNASAEGRANNRRVEIVLSPIAEAR